MLNGIFVVIVLISILLAAYTGQMQALTDGVLTDAKKAVSLSIGLVGVMAFFLGLMRVAEDGGLLRRLARLIGPAMHKIFPGVPPDHPAMSAMILNIGCNMLGLANAATPFGIRAFEELDKLNTRKGTATNAMVLFLAINTAGLAILPTGVISMRAALGSQNSTGIFVTTWFASGMATLVGITAALLLARLPRFKATAPAERSVPLESSAPIDLEAEIQPDSARVELHPPRFGGYLVAAFWLILVGLLVRHVSMTPGSVGEVTRSVLSFWILPVLIAGLVSYGWAQGVRVYDSLVEGAKQGFQVALRIIPYLVAILVGVGMLRTSGWIDMMVQTIGPVTQLIGMPAETLPMALLRPLTGSGAYGVMAEAMTAYGPDSLIGYMVSTFQGSTETTFYVLAVYCGAVGIRRTRHALPACLLADAAGLLAAVFIVNLMFG